MGGYQYAVHQYTLDRVRARQFARGWSLVLAVRALPTLFGVPIAGENSETFLIYYLFLFKNREKRLVPGAGELCF